MPRSVRRAITGHNADGKSIFIIEDVASNVFVAPKGGGVAVTELWETTESPANNSGADDAGARQFRLEPPPGGSIFRIIDYPPDTQRLAGMDREANFAQMGAAENLDRDKPRHPGFHKTDTIDYVIVLKGEIYALMDEGEVLLKEGDVLVQRGTNHAWSNRTQDVATLAFVLIDSKPA